MRITKRHADLVRNSGIEDVKAMCERQKPHVLVSGRFRVLCLNLGRSFFPSSKALSCSCHRGRVGFLARAINLQMLTVQVLRINVD